MKNVLLVLLVVFILTGCISMMDYTPVDSTSVDDTPLDYTPIKVNGVSAQYRTFRDIEYGEFAHVNYVIASEDLYDLGLSSYEFTLIKSFDDSTWYSYSLSLSVVSLDGFYLEGYKMKIDGLLFNLKDSDPAHYVLPDSTIQEIIISNIHEALIKRISETNSPIYLQYVDSELIVIEGAKLQELKQYAKGLLDINTLSDLGL